MPEPAEVAPLFVNLAISDASGRLLMQERDEHAAYAAECWSLPGGAIEAGESPHEAAVRELEEETGLADIALSEVATTRTFHPQVGWYEFVTYAALTTLTDADVECHEGRQMVFREPADLPALDLTLGTARVLPTVLAWPPYVDAHGEPGSGERCFAGVILVDHRGWVLLQERDEYPLIDPLTWGLSGGHVEPGEDFGPAAYRELAEETGLRLGPGELTLYGEFMVDHRRAYGSWDRMQVYTATTALTDVDIECHEGRRILFVDPATIPTLDLSAAATVILPAFLSSLHRAGVTP